MTHRPIRMRPRRALAWLPLLLLAVAAGLPAARAEDPPAPAAEAAPAPAPAPAPEPPAPVEPPPRALDFPDPGLIQRDDGTVVYFYRTNFVTPKELKQNLETLLKVPGVVLQEFAQQNTLLVEGEPEAVEIALEAAAYFDVAVPQAYIEAKVIEITYDSNFEFGLDYLWNRDAAGPNTLFRGAESILNPPSFIQSTLPGGLPFQGTSVLFGFVGKKAERFGLLDATLQALELEGKAEVLSKPSIICTQGIPAEFKTTEQRWVFQFDRADRNNETYKGAPLRTGVELIVKATHIGESFLTLEVNPKVEGAQVISAAINAALQPLQTTREAKTTVTMGDGETLVIGGLYTNRSVSEKAKTPLISEIPLLGQLFTRTRSSKVKTELVFMLTPHIVRKTSELRVVTPPAELDRLEAAGEEEDLGRHNPPDYLCPDVVGRPLPPGAPPVVTSAPRTTPERRPAEDEGDAPRPRRAPDAPPPAGPLPPTPRR